LNSVTRPIAFVRSRLTELTMGWPASRRQHAHCCGIHNVRSPAAVRNRNASAPSGSVVVFAPPRFTAREQWMFSPMTTNWLHSICECSSPGRSMEAYDLYDEYDLYRPDGRGAT